jgi:hypothetical protein
MTICQVCQKENPAGAEYCEDCGAALNQPAPTPVGAGVSSGGGSAAASATGTGPTASAAGSVGSLSPQGPGTSADASAPPAADVSPTPSVPTVPPTSSSSSAAASPAAPSESSTTSPSGTGAPSTGAPQAQAHLVAVRYGAPTGEEIPLFGQRLVVGRFDPETGPVDIDLSESAESGHISRQHGELFREADGSWSVRDLGSTNGVFVKSDTDPSFGPRITAPRPLKDGDEVAFGNARFTFKST